MRTNEYRTEHHCGQIFQGLRGGAGSTRAQARKAGSGPAPGRQGCASSPAGLRQFASVGVTYDDDDDDAG